MSCMNLHHYLRICNKSTIQTVCDTRPTSMNHILIDSLNLITKWVLRKNFHTTKRRDLQSLCHLKSRGVIQLSGKDTPEFLQGLVTNNVWLLTEKVPSIQYCMMLNVQGRVLYDLFVYNVTKTETESTTLLVEADAAVVDDLLKIFKKYRLRKKVDISNVSDNYQIWTEFDTGEGAPGKDSAAQAAVNTFKFHDPRVPVFASRIITDQENLDTGVEKVTEEVYRKHRYQWGIPEGLLDLPSGKCLPLESNLAYMNGVNFQKGCYIGQELTARTFHTGVIRKRLLPVILDSPGSIEPDATVTTHDKGKTAGKFRSSEGKYGLCLLRLEHVEDSLDVTSQDGRVISLKAQIPKWWPSPSS